MYRHTPSLSLSLYSIYLFFEKYRCLLAASSYPQSQTFGNDNRFWVVYFAHKSDQYFFIISIIRLYRAYISKYFNLFLPSICTYLEANIMQSNGWCHERRRIILSPRRYKPNLMRTLFLVRFCNSSWWRFLWHRHQTTSN